MRIAYDAREHAFVEDRQRDWDALDRLIHQADARGLRSLAPDELARLPLLYRDACADLARARGDRFAAPLVDYLQGLAAAGHALLYGPHARPRRFETTLRYAYLVTFPRTVRAHRGAIALAALLFFLPMTLGVIATLDDPAFAYRVAPEGMLRPLTQSYAAGFAEGRSAGEGALMAGYYVNNNVGIALRCFALGVFGGVGSALYLVQNGLSIGAILGFVASQGAGKNLLVFVIGHGSLELGAIVIAGGAGLSLGWALVAPGERTRAAALRERGHDATVLALGAAVMLLGAAAIEGFWSASSLPDVVKVATGGALFVLLALYLSLAGRLEPKGPR